MKQKVHKVFILIYALILFTPLILLALQIKVEPVNNKEKKIGLNFKRNFPLRSDLFKIYASVKNNAFKTNAIPNSAITSADGEWKFLGNKFSNVLSESKGLLTFSTLELEEIKTNLLSKKQWLAEKNIPFYLTLAASKHSHYGHLIPIKKRNRKTKREQVDSVCQILNVNVINLDEKFKEEKDHELFLKTDSHWNHLGGYYAFQSTIEEIAKEFPKTNFNFFEKNKMKFDTVDYQISDLNDMLFLPRTEKAIVVLPNDSKTQLKKLPKKLKVPGNYHFNPKSYEERYESTTNNLKALVLRDSFFGAYYHLMADNFGESVFIFWHDFDKNLIENEKPDVIIYEIQERNIDVLLDKNWHHAPN